ncbi:nucleoside triphosphate pyrophosphatase [Thiomicrorhabdus sp. 6S3-12]|uniref:Maf family protein n=1 Tax=Thiomicrorhabdus sp. 6S3-12 TaxID=2819681 RepID=UPI001AAD2C69|nr:Maf family protein [Thiomicrorhabdus sp. 6S3-12]MBO1923729.1 septum formation inhibitor Maf [Thiomicrorhabdus sp. 6S3-12]
MNSKTVFLASSSPRRQELLAQMGVAFSVLDAPIDETPFETEDAAQFVTRMAREKVQKGAQQLRNDAFWVIAGDTAIVMDGEIIGKPEDPSDAQRMLRALSGRTHQVYSSVAVWHKGVLEVELNITDVVFSELADIEIKDYVASGEPLDKAGAYAIQGEAAKWIAAINGSYYGVMGLPIYELNRILQKMGFYDPV